MSNKNPFSVNRTEYMKNLWKYYVPLKEFPDNVDKPIVVVGGRGTGKSMFFLCNSWREKYSEIEGNSAFPIQEFIQQKEIGIYYKVDSTFVGAMSELAENDSRWQGYFNTYLSISLIIEMLPLIRLLYESRVLDMQEVYRLVSAYYAVVHGQEKEFATINDVKKDCAFVLQNIEDMINGLQNDIKFRGTQPGRIFKAIVDELHTVDVLADTVFKIYIDEYESFSEWQQKIVNTLIKQSSKLLIYNVGMRHNGMKTLYTLGQNEILQPTHDYYQFNFDDLLTGKEYANSLKIICEKRLEMFFLENGITDKSKDIEYYLSTYDANREIERFERKNLKFITRLENVIRDQCMETDDVELMVEQLCLEAPVLNSRLHLALLLRANQYKPTIEQLYDCYSSWRNNSNNEQSRKYDEWLHNAKNGLIFLLAKEYSVSKWYYGFDTFVSLSSGVIRYFLELCEQTFNFAVMEGFSWEAPSPISPEIQTRAAKYVSQYKVNEISSYPRCGKRLRIFVQCFGEICRDLHQNEDSTLGEPEVNHFTTESLQLSSGVEGNLEDAVTWLVLQRLPQTKSKEELKTSILDYHLNKIYTPYFGISFNKKRKIRLDVQVLENLFSGDINIARRAANEYLTKSRGKKAKTSSHKRDEGKQLDMFGAMDYEN